MCFAYKEGFQKVGENGQHCYPKFYFALVLSETTGDRGIVSRKGYQDWTTRGEGIKTGTDKTKTKKGGTRRRGGGGGVIGKGDVVGTV